MRSLALLLLAVPACTDSSGGPAAPLQMNDLSVMFPLPQTDAQLNTMLAASATSDDGPQLIPEDMFDAAQAGLVYENLRAVAFRVDPCFGDPGPITDGPECQNQLRIVFQPLFDSGGEGFATDAAVHAFYDISRSELLDIVNEVRTAREESGALEDLGRLQPHPTILAEGLDGPFATALRKTLAKHASGDKLVRFTTLQIEEVFEGVNGGADLLQGGGSEFWTMQGFDVASGVATRFQIPTLPDNSTEDTLTASANPFIGTGNPATTSDDDIAALSDPTTAPTQPQIQAAFDAALRVENPLMNSPNTIDCVSCHLAQPSRQLNGPNMTGSPGMGFEASATIPASDLAQTTQLFTADDVVLNIHAFSYRNANPMINQRVINETAANLAYLSALLPSD